MLLLAFRKEGREEGGGPEAAVMFAAARVRSTCTNTVLTNTHLCKWKRKKEGEGGSWIECIT